MEWYHVLGIVLGNMAVVLPLWLWARAESRSDMRHLDNKLEAWRADTFSILQAIKDDMKDFHERLCSIEERYRSKQ
jgi:hypothetical protein